MNSKTTPHPTRPVTLVAGIPPEVLDSWREGDDTVIVDVREDFERVVESLPGSLHIPLSRFDPGELRALAPGKRICVYCRTGRRSEEAGQQLVDLGLEVVHLDGGLERWKAEGLPVHRSSTAPRIDVMRQVQITAGSSVLAGVILGVAVAPGFLGLSAFVGAGLVFAGATGWCGMAQLLAKMPWNRLPAPTD